MPNLKLLRFIKFGLRNFAECGTIIFFLSFVTFKEKSRSSKYAYLPRETSNFTFLISNNLKIHAPEKIHSTTVSCFKFDIGVCQPLAKILPGLQEYKCNIF